MKNYTKPKLKVSQSMFRISKRDPKQTESHPAFRTKLKARLKSFFEDVIFF